VLSTAKHFVADGGTLYGTGSSGYLIDQGDARITEAQLDAIHLPPFQYAVNAGVGSVMISYSSWNGVKDHGNAYLITTVLKGNVGFKGFVVSDWGGVKQLPDSTYALQVAHAVNAGIDMIMVPDDYVGNINAIVSDVNSGLIPQSRVDDAVTRILNTKFALGLFTQPYTDSTYTSQVGSAAHRVVARQAVRESLVLLKNDGVLPLSKTGAYKIVVGGKSVDNLGYQMGGWSISWQGGSGTTTTGGTTFWQALQQATAGTSITLQNVGTRTNGSYSGDIGIWVGGETPYAEGKGDSSTLAFGTVQLFSTHQPVCPCDEVHRDSLLRPARDHQGSGAKGQRVRRRLASGHGRAGDHRRPLRRRLHRQAAGELAERCDRRADQHG